MRVLSIIFGILMILFGITCICTPIVSAIDLSIFIVIMTAVYGVIGIIAGIAYKYYGVGFVFSIVSLIFAVIMLVVPNVFALTNVVIFCILACWIVIMGIVSAVTAIQLKNVSDSKMWILQLIIGIIAVILGIYAFLHPVAFGLAVAWIIGVLLGALFIETGCSMIFVTSFVPTDVVYIEENKVEKEDNEEK